MIKPNTRPGSLLFLCADPWLGLFAESHFNREADKLDVWWTAACKRMPSNTTSPEAPETQLEDALRTVGISLSAGGLGGNCQTCTVQDLNEANLLITLQFPDSKSTKESFPTWKGNSEVWVLSRDLQRNLAIIKETTDKLLVKLILQGGKRPPLAKPPAGSPRKDQNDKKVAGKGSTARVGLESKGRGGKKVTVVSGLLLDAGDLDALASELRQSCGVGGTVKEGSIEIQGDKRTQVMDELQRRGFKPKRAGG